MADLIVGQGILGAPLAIVSQKAPCGEGVAVILSDQLIRGDAPQNQWIVTVEALFDDGSYGVIGRVLTQRPSTNTEPRSRVVAVANMPGARGWRASFRGATGQKAWAQLVAGNGVGAGVPGVWASRPRPRDYARGASRLVAAYDSILMSVYVSDTSDPAAPIPVGGLWVQFFNKRTAPVAGDIPIFERKILPNGSFDVLFDTGTESGDARYALGLGWALSSTPGVLTPAAAGPNVSVEVVQG